MRTHRSKLLLCMTICCAISFFAFAENPSISLPSESLLAERLCRLNSHIGSATEAEVMPFVKGWLTREQAETEAILGRILMYFPIFEHHLKALGLPEELKILPIVESNLRPHAKSVKGASGLWQFTAQTGKRYGLHISSVKDERRDPHLSSEAAARYLARLFRRFGTWELALLAYNCGEGKLQAAIKAAGCDKISALRRFLPSETCDFLPRFLAARYLVRFHSEHGLTPTLPAPDLLMSRPVMVFSDLTFREISQQTGVEIAVLKALNPSLLHHRTGKGKAILLVLPDRVAARFLVPKATCKSLPRPAGNFSATRWVVQQGDTPEKLALLTGCTVPEIIAWNGLRSSALFLRQELTLWFPTPLVSDKRA